MNIDVLLSDPPPAIETRYGFKDTILYALSVGFGADPLDPAHLRFVYEEGLQAVPTMANVLGYPGFWAKEPRYGIAWRQLLHAEQRLVLHAPLPAEGHVIGRNSIMGWRDRGAEKGVFLHHRKDVVDVATGQLFASLIASSLLRADGGCGDHGEAPEELPTLPQGAADFSILTPTPGDAALLYRLNGDFNPLHVDPSVARAGGFDRPILHGLATMGYACHALLKGCCKLDPGRLKSMAVRFSRPVLPGDTIRFDVWRESPTRARFRAVVPERDLLVLDRGLAELA